jgi:hypothetical protein
MDLHEQFALEVLFEVRGFVLSCESSLCAVGDSALYYHFFATLLPHNS